MQLRFIISIMLFIPFMAFAQNGDETSNRKTEIDFLFSYYEQSGNNSAVSGGKGTEELHDYTGILIVNVPIKKNKNLRIENGISYFTSASYDNINPNTITSASYADQPIYLDITYSTYDTAQRHSYGINGRVMFEEYFGSISMGGYYSKLSQDLNREIKFSANFFVDKWALYYPIKKLYPVELKYTGIEYVDTDKRYSSNFEINLSQVINKRMQASISLGMIIQTGLLSAPYHRVYFKDEELPRVERLPDIKYRIPVALKVHYFLGDRFIFRSFYRYYWDTFGVKAHTFNIEIPYKITNFFSFQPFYRIHIQKSTRYFAPYKEHNSSAEFYTSDYDLSDFTSHFIGAGLRYSPAMGISKFNLSKKTKKSFIFSEIQLRSGSYHRSDGMKSMLFSCGFSFLH
ncbi:MAG: DUF3570 domain-containing protein [Cyclobacteriaceae bacterium]|nr:DUF3570 domain-containing protein [Cyclobacteriaceae bacterium]